MDDFGDEKVSLGQDFSDGAIQAQFLRESRFGSLEQGDVLLIASDGLTGMLEDDQLAKIIQTDSTPELVVSRMIAEANRHGGLDNITAIVVRNDDV